jgi:Cu(I)/Ag(I) efflux system membrane fusion protein
MDEQSVEVLEGLRDGDNVVVSAQFLLDSESSKSSDFMRMHREPTADREMDHRHHHQHGGDAP